MASGFNSMRAMAELMGQMDKEETVTIIEATRDLLDALAENPEVIKTFSSILMELSEDDDIAEGLNNLFAMVGPAIEALNNMMTEEVVDLLHDMVQDDEFKEGVGSFLSIMDPEVMGVLLPVIGSVVGAILSDLAEDEEAREHLIGLVSHGGALTEKVNTAFMGEPVE